MTSPAIVVDGVSKSFRLPRERVHTLKERALHPLRRPQFDELKALRDVSFAVESGEFFAVVGRNGSGKSTLLKCMAGIYGTDAGRIFVNGQMSTFIELGVGFNPDLPARENVMINATMLGLSPREARNRFDRVIDFAELRDFTEVKLKNYSSGMLVRLAFAVAIQVDADILLIDEVLAVGDAAFQQKCFEQFERLKDAGKTIVFVTHDMSSVERFCDRALLLERGKLVAIGAPGTVARRYNQLNFGRIVHADVEGERQGDHVAAEITAAWFEDVGFNRQTAMPQGEFCHVCVEVTFHEDMQDPIFAWGLRNESGLSVMNSTTFHDHPRTGHFKAGQTVVARTGFALRIAGNRYTLSPSIARRGSGADLVDVREDLVTLLVHSSRITGGVVDLEQVFVVEE